MSDIDKAVELAQHMLAHGENPVDGNGTMKQVEYLARAVLAMAPVFAAAKEWRAASCERKPNCDPCDGSHDDDCAEWRATRGLASALDALEKEEA